MQTLLQDLRFSFRTLLRNPGFALSAVLLLSLGIGATSAITSVVIAVLVERLPYEDPDRLVVFAPLREVDGLQEEFPSSYLDLQDWKAHSTSFEDVGIRNSFSISFNLLGEGEPERVGGEMVNAAYFRVLRVEPMLGRAFTPEDDSKPGGSAVAVLGHALWQRRFGSDPQIVGKSLLLDGRSFQVVGVVPPRFRGISDEGEIWVPASMCGEILGDSSCLDRRGVRWLAGLARLKPGVSVERAQQEMDAITAALAKEFPDTNENTTAEVKTLEEWLFGDLRFPLLTLLGASLFVLLIAWTTVANMLLVRATVRHREISVRVALGATRPRLLRLLLTESLVLAGLSCFFGLLLAHWSTGLLVALSAIKLQSFVDVGLDPLVVATIISLSLATGACFGLAPGWLGIRASALRQAGGGRSMAQHRFQSSLVVAEVALALFLLVGAMLLVESFQQMRQIPLGFDPANLLTVRVDLKDKRYADTKIMTRLARQYRDHLKAIPGVKSAAVQGPGIPSDTWNSNSFVIEDLLDKTKDGAVRMVFHHVSPGYFREMGIPLLEGRDFTEAENDTTPLSIIISEEAARKFWPGQSPLGRRMRFGRRDTAPWFTIVGVVGDLNNQAMQVLKWPGPDVYMNAFQFPPLLTPQLNFLIRSRDAAPLSLVSRVESALRAVAPEAPPFDARTMEYRLSQFTAKDRLLVLLMGLFAGLALLLAAMGLYGVLLHSVTQRTHELGVRVALGAQTGDLLFLVMGRAAWLAGIGLAIGLASAAVVNRLFENLLYGVNPVDGATLLAASLLLFAVAMAASFLPARRALKIQPVIALRTE